MRQFETGATRNNDDHKLDYEGFLSPLALREFAKYMHSHRFTEDGPRPSDNWQRGIPLDAYMKSMWRHFFNVWELHRGLNPVDPDTGDLISVKESLCALLFNVQGYLHEWCRKDREDLYGVQRGEGGYPRFYE